ncbi:MAG: alpha/beta hydrolase [Mycobacterium sp.]|nr:alpha/beta hydrolase [Mycobacterium sp.]
MIRRMLTTMTVAGVAAAMLGAGAAEAQPVGSGDRPTVVLVHGAFADSSSWDGVVSRLEAGGFPVVAVANPLRGLAVDAEYVRSVVAGVGGPVVLAGHSYGGSVMSQAADGLSNVKALVYVASFILEVGESTGELAGKFPGAQLGAALDAKPFPLAGGGQGSDLYIRAGEFRRVFAADVAPDVAGLMAVSQRPIAAAALEESAGAAAWKSVPSWNLVTLQDLAIPAESMRFMGQRAGSRNVEVEASHAVTVSQPGVVADLITEAANSTQSRH